jgi:hypothetical protein
MQRSAGRPGGEAQHSGVPTVLPSRLQARAHGLALIVTAAWIVGWLSFGAVAGVAAGIVATALLRRGRRRDAVRQVQGREPVHQRARPIAPTVVRRRASR